jgi:hypothetical protein
VHSVFIQMKIKANIAIRGADADLVAIPLMPDNTDRIKTAIKEKSAVTAIEATKIGTLIASVDDYLMNAKVARDMVELVEREKG